MDKDQAKISLKVGEIEFSIEGSTEYVEQQYKQMEKRLNLKEKLESSTKTQRSRKPQNSSSKTSTKKYGFKGWLEKLPKGLKKRDYALVAAYFNQSKSKDATFRTRDVSSTLKAQGIKVANPSIMIQNLAKKGEVIKEVQQEGRQKHFQFTTKGEKEMQGLLNAQGK